MMKTFSRFLKLALPFCLTSTIVFFTCNEEPTKPDDTDKPGKRDYSWTIDTLYYPQSSQIFMSSIWASSKNDVYVVGHNDRSIGVMFHYDGIRWTPVKLHPSEGGTVQGGLSLTMIQGISKDDIYAVGEEGFWDPMTNKGTDSSVILHFDGIRWSKVEHERKNLLQGLFCLDKNIVYTGGIYGTFYEYDGNTWRSQAIDSSLWFNCIGGNMNEQYALAYNNVNTIPWNYLLQRIAKKWTVIDSFPSDGSSTQKFGQYNLISIEGDIYSVGANGVFIKNGTTWNHILQLPGRSIGSIYGTRKKHIFCGGLFGEIYHYNGSAWEKIDEISTPYRSFGAIWCDEEEVFVVSHLGAAKTIIFHGK